MKLFADNRTRFFEKLPNNSIALFCSAPPKLRNNDEDYKYRQDSDFYYLTGFVEPNSLAVFIKTNLGACKFILFNTPSDPLQEIWTGKLIGQQAAVQQYGADEAFSINEVNNLLPELFAHKSNVFYPFNRYPEFTQNVFTWLAAAASYILDNPKNDSLKMLSHLRLYKSEVYVKSPAIHNSSQILSELRLIKSSLEIERMQIAAQTSAEAFVELMKICKPGMYEYQLESTFRHYCAMRGCVEMACGTVAADGCNACTLHYDSNKDILHDGDLVLVDTGSEYEYYASDIARTFPVNGKFTEEQRAIYSIVLSAQKAGISAVKPGALWLDVLKAIDTHIAQGLIDLGIIDGELEEIVNLRKFQEYYMHGYGHWLGIDIHDVGSLHISDDNQERVFYPGMVLTIEPGIYIRPEAKVAEKWKGIGIRIEDDVLVTETGNRVLSAYAPKEIYEIETLMASVKNSYDEEQALNQTYSRHRNQQCTITQV